MNTSSFATRFALRTYEPSYYYFELVETTRKLLLTGALVFFGPGISTQIVVAMVICVAMIKVLNISRPYNKDHHNIFHEIMQWQIFFMLLAAMMIKLENSNPASGGGGGISKSGGFDTMLVCMQGVGPVLLVVIVMMSLKVKRETALEKRRQKRDKKKKEHRQQHKETELVEVDGGRRSSGFVAENPMFKAPNSKAFLTSEVDDEVITPPVPPSQKNQSVLRPNDEGLLAIGKRVPKAAGKQSFSPPPSPALSPAV